MSKAEEKEDKKYYIFGRNIAKIPCFRDSMLTGAVSGSVAGIAYFLFTSNSNRILPVAFGVYGVTTFGYYSVCYYRWYQTQLLARKIRMRKSTRKQSVEEQLDLGS